MEDAQKIVAKFQAKKIKHVVFDWNNTVLSVHEADLLPDIYHTASGNDSLHFARWTSAEIQVKGASVRCNRKNFANASLFREVVLQCVKAGISVYILSFGLRYFIKKDVELLFGRDQTIFSDTNVFTPSDFGVKDYFDMGDKNDMLMKVSSPAASFCFGISKSSIVYYDDSSINVAAAKKEGYCWTSHVQRRGLSTVADYLSF